MPLSLRALRLRILLGELFKLLAQLLGLATKLFLLPAIRLFRCLILIALLTRELFLPTRQLAQLLDGIRQLLRELSFDARDSVSYWFLSRSISSSNISARSRPA